MASEGNSDKKKAPTKVPKRVKAEGQSTKTIPTVVASPQAAATPAQPQSLGSLTASLIPTEVLAQLIQNLRPDLNLPQALMQMASSLNPAAVASFPPPAPITEAAPAEDAYNGATVEVEGDEAIEAAAGEEKVEMTGVGAEVAQEVETAGVQTVEEETGDGGEEESQKETEKEETQEEQVPMEGDKIIKEEVVVTPIEEVTQKEVVEAEAEVNEAEAGVEEAEAGVDEEKETAVDEAVEMEKEAEVEAPKKVIDVGDDSEEEPPRRVVK